MPRQANAFWVGAFVLGGLALALIAVVWLGTSDWFQERDLYATYFDSSVQGLNVDAEVKFRGVKVGKVARTGIAPDGNLVEVLLELDPDFKVNERMRTRLGYTGITGLRYLEIDYADPDKLERHPELGFKTPHPVIPSQPGGFQEIEESLKDIYDKLVAVDTEGISARLVRFLEVGTEAAVSADSLFHRPELLDWSIRLSRAADQAEILLAGLNTRGYEARIDSALAELLEGSRRFHAMAQRLDEEAGRLQVSAQATQLFETADDLLRTSQGLVNRTQYSTLQTLNGLRSTLTEMNAAIEQMNALMISLESYPSNILYTAPPAKEQ